MAGGPGGRVQPTETNNKISPRSSEGRGRERERERENERERKRERMRGRERYPSCCARLHTRWKERPTDLPPARPTESLSAMSRLRLVHPLARSPAWLLNAADNPRNFTSEDAFLLPPPATLREGRPPPTPTVRSYTVEGVTLTRTGIDLGVVSRPGRDRAKLMM